MKPLPILLTALAGALGLGCDALVGGACADGYALKDGACAPVADASDGGGGSAEGGAGVGGEGDGGDGLGGGLGGGSSLGGAGPVDNCDGGQWLCGGACVDLDSDALHCGGCFNACPTHICIDGQCKGGPSGHVVVAGMSYLSSTAASRQILGNAVFLPTPHTVRILEYRAHADPATSANVTAVIDGQAALRGRAVDLGVAETPGAIAAALDVAAYDVLLVHDQPLMPPGEPADFAKTAGSAIARFAGDGGTVIVLAVSPVMADLLSATALLDTLGFVSISGATVHAAAPTDALSVGVAAPMLAANATSVIVTGATPGPELSFVFSDDSPAHNPVVIHRVVAVE